MRIACVLANGFEDSEFRVPFDRFRAAGHEVTLIGAQRGDTLTGDKGREQATTDVSIADARADRFDALFIPGGHSPDQLRADDRFIRFTEQFKAKPVFAICHGPQLLITAKMVRGRTMTAWKTIQVDLDNAGARVVDKDVVVDKNFVTSRQPDDLDAFVRAALGLLSDGASARA